MEEKNKSKNAGGIAIIFIIGVLIIGLIVCVKYTKNLKTLLADASMKIENLEREKQENKNQYDKIKGTYKGEVEVYNGSTDSEAICTYYLQLKEDGTFSYNYSYDVPESYYGNYIIEDSQIILNKLFNQGSDVRTLSR